MKSPPAGFPKAKVLTGADADRARALTAGYESNPTGPDGRPVVTDYRAVAKTPNPKTILLPQTSDWQEARDQAARLRLNGPLIILGAGSTLLDHDLTALEHHASMGVNWHLCWFQPTYMHILDKQPFRKEVVENPSQHLIKSQLVTAQTTYERFLREVHLPVLGYSVKDDSCGKHPSWRLAWGIGEMFQNIPNSLAYAIQTAVVLGFRRIVLAGFDFGGLHFFGDGVARGCLQHFGGAGETKRYLMPMLEAQAHQMHQRGYRVTMAGPTKLTDCYPVYDSLEDAIRGTA
jgi:hypothetical protein